MYRNMSWREHHCHHWGRHGFFLPGIVLLGFLLFFGGKIIFPLLFIGFLGMMFFMWNKGDWQRRDWSQGRGEPWGRGWYAHNADKQKNDSKPKNDDLDSQPYV